MPPVPLKCTLMFRDNGGTGWSEIHYRMSSGSAPALDVQLTNLVDNIVPPRVELLSEDCECIGARVSYGNTGAVASLSTKFFRPGVSGQAGVSAALSLAVKFVDATKSKLKICHLRGFWDSIERDGEYHPELPPAAGWDPRFNDWKAALIANSYGWLTKDPLLSAKGQVVSYVSGADGHVTFTLANVTGAMPPVGTQQVFRFSRLNGGNSALNGQFLVEVLTPTSLRTVKQVAAGPFIGVGKFQYRGVGFVAYNQVYSVALGRRAQGRPFFLLPGRGPVRKRF